MAIFSGIAAAIGTAFNAVSTFIGGLGTIGSFVLKTAVGVGTSLLGQALAGKPAEQKFSVTTELQAGGDLPRSIIFGYTATAGSLQYANTWGRLGETDNAFLTQVIQLADYPVQDLVELWVNGELCTIGETPHPEYGFPVTEYFKDGHDNLWIRFYDGTQTAADPFLVSRVSSANRPYSDKRVGRGIPYVVVTSLVTKNLFSGIPSFRFGLHGAKLYDPSRDSTVGGVGSHRRGDPSTWGGDGDFLPAVQLYALQSGITYGGEWLYGLQNMAAGQFPVSHWIGQIEKCRAGIESADGTVPTYRSGGEVEVNVALGEAIDAFLTACQGKVSEIGGVYKLHLGAPDAPVMSFTDDEILSTEEQSFTPFFGLADTINGISARYPSPADGWNMKVAPPLYRADLEALAGNRRLMADVSLDFVPYAEQVQRLMKSALEEAQRARRHTFVLPPAFWPLEPGDIVAWTSARNGYVNKLFRVDGVVDRANLDVMVDLTEVDPADYDWNSGAEFKPPVSGSLGPVRPTPQVIVDWFAQAWQINDASGTGRRPAIRLSWDGNQPDVDAVAFEVALAETLEVIYRGRTDEPEAGAIVISQGLLPIEDYLVRGRYVPRSDRDTAWSGWLSVRTLNIAFTGSDILDATITELKLADRAVSSAKIQVAAVIQELIASNAVVASKIADLAITQQKVADNAISVNKILNGAVTAAKIQDAAITLTKFASGLRPVENFSGSLPATGNSEGRVGTLNGQLYRFTDGGWTKAVEAVDISGELVSAQIANSAVTQAKIAAAAIDASRLQNNAVTELKIATDAVTAAKLATGSVLTDKLADNAVVLAKLASNSVDAAKLVNGAVTQLKIALNSINSDRIVDGTIIETKIAGNAVTTGKIAANSVTSAEIATNAVVAGKIAAGAVTAIAILAGAVTADAVAANAITTAKIAAAAVTANELAVGSVIAGKIAANAVTTASIAAGAVTANEIAANAVVAGKIAADAISAREVVISDFENLVPDSSLTSVASWIYSTEINFTANSNVAAFKNPVVARFNPAGGAVGSYAQFRSKRFPVESGVEYQQICDLWRAGAGAATVWVRLNYYDAYGDLVPSPNSYATTYAGTIAAGSARFEATLIPPGTAAFAEFAVYFERSLTTAQTNVTYIGVFRRKNANLIVDGAIIADKLAANAVVASKIATNAITADKIAANAIVAGKIAANAVTTATIATGAVTATEIAAGAVSAAKMAIGFGGNLFYNTDFSQDLDHWNFAATADWGGNVNFQKRTLVTSWGGPSGTMMVHQTNNVSSGYCDVLIRREIGAPNTGGLLNRVPVTPGKTYELSAQLSLHRCNAIFYLQWYDASNASITAPNTGTIPAGSFSATDPDSWPRYGVRGVAPANAVSVRPIIRKLGTLPGDADSYMFVNKPMLAEVPANASELAQYVPGGGTMVDSNGIVTNAVTADKILAASIIAGKIATNAVTTTTIAAGAVTANELAANSVIAAKIAAGAILAASIGTHAVTADKIAANAVTADKILAGSVTAAKISVGSLAAISAVLGNVDISNANIGSLIVGESNIGFKSMTEPAAISNAGSYSGLSRNYTTVATLNTPKLVGGFVQVDGSFTLSTNGATSSRTNIQARIFRVDTGQEIWVSQLYTLQGQNQGPNSANVSIVRDFAMDTGESPGSSGQYVLQILNSNMGGTATASWSLVGKLLLWKK
ncbi:phage tail protein [Georhizobium sp. MAB10]|uniref:phage tail protein n=1 Tax=Georhizobium sp. MAB10 TaxID=3028319 RepID=UPI0038558749